MSTENVEQGGDLTNLLLQASQTSKILQSDNRKLADENVVLRQKITELEEEVQRLRQSLGGSNIWPFTRRSISNISIEILRMIFAELFPQEDRPHCETSAWADAFSARYAVARVCRMWYDCCIEKVYEHIHLSRLAQLPRLVRTLETSSTMELARFIMRVDLNFFIPKGWESLYRQDLRRLLSVCPSIRVVDHTLSFETEPQLDPIIYATLAVFLDKITCLSLGHDAMSFEVQCRLISNLSTLQELEFHPGILDDSPEGYSQKFTAKLPRLFSLSIFLDSETCRSIRYLTLWTMPSIRRLSVTEYSQNRQWEPVQANQLLSGLCSTHGANLSFFSLDLSVESESILAGLVTYFPKIEHLAFCPVVEEVLCYPAMPSLRQIDFINASWDGLEQHLDFIAESRNSHFPSLNTVRILDDSYSVTPADYFIIPSRFLDILREWTTKTQTLGIELQNDRGDAVEIHRRYRMQDREEYLTDVREYEHEIDFEEESDDTCESPTSEDDYSCSESDVSLSCLSDHPEGGHPEPEMDHDTVLRLWDQMQQDDGDDEMSDASECTDWNDSTDEEFEI